MNLKTAYEPYFKIGAAISWKNLHTAADMKLLNAQFNSFTCENDMKPMYYLHRLEVPPWHLPFHFSQGRSVFQSSLKFYTTTSGISDSLS